MVVSVVLYVVYELLRVLNANAYGEWFGLEKPSVAVKKIIYVACRMACGEDYGAAFKGEPGCAMDSFDVMRNAVYN